ncbi:MAG: hypothetical protein KAS84_07640 [Anaerolineales bacterium]|nr:hypothetical protein [Anaerolineales bacterium]
MSTWKSLLKDDATEWLLEESNPFIRYFTLRWLLEKTDDDPEVLLASQAIARSDAVNKLLRRQRPEGYWGSDTRPHHGTKDNLQLLMFVGYKGDERVKKGLEYRIKGCLQDDGSYGIELKGRIVKVPCHGADLLQQMIWFGYNDDPRAKKLLNWLLDIQEEDGVWPCVSKLKPFSCLWATADVLRAYRELPPEWISPQVVESRIRAIEQFLNSNLYQYGRTKPSPRWLEFGFPLRFDSDILEVLELIAPYISPNEERIQEGLNLVLKKQDESGRWPCEKHPKGGQWMDKFIGLEEIGQPSKWVTLHALRMLKSLFEEKIN